MTKRFSIVLFQILVLLLSCIAMTPPSSAAIEKQPFIFGILLVGPYNDHGWSQAHFEAGEYVQARLPNCKMIYIDKVNPADRQGVTVTQLVDDMVEKGARLVIANSDDMKDGIREAARRHPDIHFLHISGDDVLTGKAPPNLSNLMGRMEYGKMMAGFAAAMTSQTGKIGYLGPLINEETRRLAVSCYLGARYAWEKVRGKSLNDLQFHVNWIGFWFNIPGVTSDPTQVCQQFFDTGYDVIVSGIDTTEAVIVAQQKRNQGKTVWAIPYDYIGACDSAPQACLGVPYFNWGPRYLEFIQTSIGNSWKQSWIWSGPDWKDINNKDTSTIGFMAGPALSPSTKNHLLSFINQLGHNEINLFTGPLSYQDGRIFLKEGETADDKKVWYMEQLLKGMSGQSSAK